MWLDLGVLRSSIGNVAVSKRKTEPDTIETNNELFCFFKFKIRKLQPYPQLAENEEKSMCILSKRCLFSLSLPNIKLTNPPQIQTLHFYAPLMSASLLALQICALLPRAYPPISLTPASICIQMLSICHIQYMSK